MSDPDGPAATLAPPPAAGLNPHTPKTRRRAVGIAIALAGAVAVGCLTLWPLPMAAKQSRLTPVWCLVCGDVGMQDVLQNVLMLLPVGLGLGLAGWRPRRAALAGFALSFMVELLQYTVVPGRDASLSDVVTNTLGAAFGALIAARLDWLLYPPPRDAARLAASAVGTWGLLWVAAGWLLSASAGPAPWHMVLQPEMIDAPPFPGRIGAAEFGGTPLRAGRQAVAPLVLTAYAHDSVAFRADVVTGPPSGKRTGLLEVRDGDSTLQMTIAEQDGAVRFAMRTHSSRLLLRPLVFRAPAAAPPSAGTRVVLGVRREAGAITVWPSREGERGSRAAIGPHWLATVLLPVDARPGLGWEIFAYLWVTALLLGAGWWLTLAPYGSRLTLAFASLAVVIGGLRTVPPLFHLSDTSAVGWLMACGALVLGLLLGRAFAPDDR